MGIFNLFKPAPKIKEIKDEEVVKKKYFYWRMRTFYSIYIGYAFFYFTRKTFKAVSPILVTDLRLIV